MLEIFAHRGLSGRHPENSFAALTEALGRGFGIETDLRLTKDEDFVIIHDDNLGRITGIEKEVRETTLAEACRLKYANSDEHIISLRELLGWMSEHPSFRKKAIHLKADSQSETGLNLLARYWREFNLYDAAFTFDLTKEAATRLKEIDPKIQIALIVSEHKFEPTVYLWNEVKNFKPMDIVWSAEYRKLYSKEFVDGAKATGRTVYAMSPDVHTVLGHPLAHDGYENTWDNLVAWGIEGICTDHPEKLRKRLKLT